MRVAMTPAITMSQRILIWAYKSQSGKCVDERPCGLQLEKYVDYRLHN
jgi:hypothetical protein